MSNGIVSNSAASSTTVLSSTPREDTRGSGTLLLSRGDVERLLPPDECIAAVEDAYRQHALEKSPPPGILGLHAQDGGFHIKAALLTLDQPYFAAKTNANFPHNGARYGLTALQDVAAADVYRRALDHGESTRFSFNA